MTGPRSLATRLWSRMRGALWPLPTLGVAVALVLGVLLPGLDNRLDGPDGHPLTFAFGGGPSAARDLLAAIAGSLISVTGLVFSLTVVALQLASSQYSPRLLQTFATDGVVQATLGWLASTFVYALTVLRTVRTESATETETAFVPRLAISVAFVLAVGSVLALLFFLGHLARSLRVETMLRDVHDESTPVLDRELPRDRDTRGPDGSPVRLPTRVPDLVVCAEGGGFVVDIEDDRICAAASRDGAIVLLARRIGDPVVPGVPLAHVWRGGSRDAEERDAEELAAEVRGSVLLAYERSTVRDVAYSLRKVVDIAVRALSPGINDPTTAVHALSHTSAMLGDLLERPLHERTIHDEEGTLRVVVPNWDAKAVVSLAVEEPLHLAAGQPAVLRRMASLLREVAWRVPRGLVDAELRDAVERCAASAEESTAIPPEECRGWREDVEAALAGRWDPRLPPRLRTEG